MRKQFVSTLLLCLAPVAAQAAPDLVAVGTLSGNYQDLATETAAPLESGIAGNALGGLGSGLAYAGGNTFLSVPDRGPNAAVYDAAIDNTTSFIPRFHTLSLSLAPSPSGSALPLTLTPFLLHTTLLSSSTDLVYGSGAGLGVGPGAPSLNDKHTFYFSGRSDNYDPTQPSTDANDARFDPESIRVSRDGENVYITDEYGPFVYKFDRATGRRVRSYALPAKFAVSNLSPVGDTEISGNTAGRVANKGMEGVAISPDGSFLYGVMQSPLIQDGGTDGPITRIVKIDVQTGATSEYAYQLDNIGTVAKPKYPTISDIVAVNDHEFLLDERDGKGLGDGSSAVIKKIYHVDITGAADVSAITGAANLAGKAPAKVLFLDIVGNLTGHGFTPTTIPAKLEGIAFGQDVTVNGAVKHTLYVSNDNDFTATVGGLDNPNRFFVFAFAPADLPGLEAQHIDSDDRCGDGFACCTADVPGADQGRHGNDDHGRN